MLALKEQASHRAAEQKEKQEYIDRFLQINDIYVGRVWRFSQIRTTHDIS